VVIPQALWFAGFVFLMAVALLLLARGIVMLRARNLVAFFELIGSKSALAEAREEIEAVERGFAQERRP
jgi:hypothetical protein